MILISRVVKKTQFYHALRLEQLVLPRKSIPEYKGGINHMPSNLFVVFMGIGTVFFGLVCIIILSTIMSKICARIGEKTAAPTTAAAAEDHAAPAAQTMPVQNRQAMIAAISAAIAEDLGTDLTGIRILSVKKL